MDIGLQNKGNKVKNGGTIQSPPATTTEIISCLYDIEDNLNLRRIVNGEQFVFTSPVLHHRSYGKSASLNTNINMLELNSRDLRLCVLGRRHWIT